MDQKKIEKQKKIQKYTPKALIHVGKLSHNNLLFSNHHKDIQYFSKSKGL